MPTARDPSQPKTPARILLVDDDSLITQLIVDMLSLDGHDVDTAPNGIAALNRVQRRRYDLILTDLHMPELDGWAGHRRQVATLRRARWLPATRSAGRRSNPC